ncbi:porin family protein [Porphyromonas endodontalis]|uniref:porin family protein n=1 Tax=Porphyromonas endodontalis TaxID=28124 RepID=UPI0028E7E01C|nr:porin family protein [Porphyromonas endodontalis]
MVSLAVALICTATASAQMFNLRVEAGPVFSFSSLAEHGTKVHSAGTKVGYHVGALADISLTKGLYASTGLSFEMKGSKDHSYLDGKTLKVSKEALNEITMHYLQVPINVGYGLSLTPSIRFAVQTGPYFAVALGGTQKTKSRITEAVKSFNIFKEGVFGLDKPNRFDLGWGASAMLYLGSIYGTVGADFGFLNVAQTDPSGIANEPKGLSLKNSTVHIGLGYCF